MPDLYAHRPGTRMLVPRGARVWRTFSARPERVFDAFLDPDLIRSWFGPGLGEIIHLDVRARVGGRFSISQQRDHTVVDTHGTYHALERPRKLVLSWATPAAKLQEGLVTVEIEPRSDGGSTVTLTHDLDASWLGRIAEVESGWMNMLDAMSEAMSQMLGSPATEDPSIAV